MTDPLPGLRTLAGFAQDQNIADFAAQAARLKLPSANLDPLEALLARHPRSPPFTEFLKATLLLRTKLAAWRQGLTLPLPQSLRQRRTTQGQPLGDALGYVYNPWVYASEPFARFLEAYGPRERLVCLIMGLNPGKWGMTQTGIPLADPFIAETHLNIMGQVQVPDGTYSGVPVKGFDSRRKEGSGTAISALMCQRWGLVFHYYQFGYVMNFCPLLMLDADGKNITPADLLITHPALRPLRDLCDAYLACVVWLYRPAWIISLGGHTEERTEHVLNLTGLRETSLSTLLHPSHRARRSWSGTYPSWVAYAAAHLTKVGAP